MSARSSFLWILGFGLVAALSACPATWRNEDHCVLHGGDAYCAWVTAGDRPFCATNEPTGCERATAGADATSCVAQAPAEACHRPEGETTGIAITTEGDGNATTDDGSTGIARTTSSATETTALASEASTLETEGGSDPSLGTTGEPPECLEPSECPLPEASICSAEGICVSCSDAAADACGSRNPATPVCLTGTCVACDPSTHLGCGGQTPICDPALGVCRACAHHDECGPAALCLAEAGCAVGGIYVDPTAPEGGDGSPQAPFRAIDEAMAATEGVDPLILRLSGHSHLAAIVADERIVAVAPASEGEPVLIPGGSAPLLRVTAEGDVFADRVTLRGSTSRPAIEVEGGAATLTRVGLVDNPGGAVLMSSGRLVLVNALVTENGFSGDERAAITLGSGSMTMLDTMLLENVAAPSWPANIACDDRATISVRNSVIATAAAFEAAGEDTDTDGMAPFEPQGERSVGCAFPADWSAVDASAALGTGAVLLTTYDPGWLLWPQGRPPRLSATGRETFAGIARWQAGDPRVDFNGTPRVAVDGAPETAGALLP